MSTAARRTTRTTLPTDAAVPPLYNGDRLTQAEFHRRYEAMPEDFKAELIGGKVYVSSPLRLPHGTSHLELGGALWLYKTATPGVQLMDNTTTILGEESEAQPDLALRILPEFGGRSRTSDKLYVLGPPELVVEVAHASVAIDLFEKKEDYQRAGVVEYVVLCVEEEELHWFALQKGRQLKPDAKGIFRSQVFPGLWIDGIALLKQDSSKLLKVVQRGLKTPEHAAFVRRLQSKHRQ